MRITYSPGFYRGYKKLPSDIQVLAESKEKIFLTDPFDPILKTHKLHGKFKEFWSFSLDSKYRIIFQFIAKANEAHFHTIGDHSIYE